MADLVAGGRHLAERTVVIAALLVAMVAPVVVGLATSYLVAILAAAGIIILLLTRGVDWRPDAMSWTVLTAFGVLVILAAITARTPVDLRFALNFAALPLYWPLSVLLRRGAHPDNASRIADFALVGVVLALLICLVEVYALGAARAGRFLTDPIRLANTAVILAFLCVGAAVASNSPRRWLSFIAPGCALAVVFLTQARIAMVAFPIVAAIAILVLSPRKLIGLGLVALMAAGLAAIAFSDLLDSPRLDTMFATISEVLAGRTPSGDQPVRIRFALYEAGWQAFQQSPIFGHGWGRMMSAAGQFLERPDRRLVAYPHLHNEVLTFAVFSGLVGVALYAVIMAAPLIVALRSPHDSQRGVRIAGTTILVVAYAVMGLTDTMLAFELHTALFVAWNAVLLAYCRDAPPPPRTAQERGGPPGLVNRGPQRLRQHIKRTGGKRK